MCAFIFGINFLMEEGEAEFFFYRNAIQICSTGTEFNDSKKERGVKGWGVKYELLPKAPRRHFLHEDLISPTHPALLAPSVT